MHECARYLTECAEFKTATEDAIFTALHSVFTHLENNNTYIRMLYVDFSSAFNTVSPMKLISKLSTLEYHSLHLDIRLPHEQAPDSLDWWSHLLHSSAQHRRPPELCAQPPPVHAVHLRLQSPT